MKTPVFESLFYKVSGFLESHFNKTAGLKADLATSL